MAIDMTGYVADTTEAGVPQPTAERLAELQAANNNQTILGMNVPTGTTIPVGMIPPDAQTGIVPTGQKALDTFHSSVTATEPLRKDNSVWSTFYPRRTSPGEVWKNRAREENVKQDALLSMGYNPGETTVEEFLNRPGMSTLYQNKINLFAYGTENPTFTEFSMGSDAIITANDAKQTLGMYEQIANQKKREQAILGVDMSSSVLPTALENQIMDTIKAQMNTNTMYNQQLIDNLKAQSQAAQKAQEVQNKLAQGASAWQLAKMGALGTTMSGQSYLLSVEQAGLDKLNQLALDYQDKILEAQKEMNDGNYKSSMDLMNFAMDIEKRISDEKQQQFTNSLKLADEMRAQEEFNRKMIDWAQEDIGNLIGAGFNAEDFSNEDKREYEAKAGYPPGTFDKLYDVVKGAAEAQTYAQQLEIDKKKYDILKDIPSTTQVNIGGNLESGLKQVTPNVWEQVVTDASGKVTLVTFDENTKEMKTYDTGIVSAVKGGSTSYSGSAAKSSYTLSNKTIPGSATDFMSVAGDLYYKATGEVAYNDKMEQITANFLQNIYNDADKAKSAQSATLLQATSKAGAGLPSGIKTDAELFNDTINSYYTNPTSNPFYRAPVKEETLKYELVEGVETLVGRDVKIK